MLPPVTNWPPNRLTPSICGFESRPLRELPTPFLCAMLSDLDLRDTHARGRLPVAAVPPIVFPALELHDAYLAPAPLRHHFAGHARLREPVTARDQLAVLVDEQHRGELDLRALVSREMLDGDHLPRRHAVLLAAGRDHRFHARSAFPECWSDSRLWNHSGRAGVNSGRHRACM